MGEPSSELTSLISTSMKMFFVTFWGTKATQ